MFYDFLKTDGCTLQRLGVEFLCKLADSFYSAVSQKSCGKSVGVRGRGVLKKLKHKKKKRTANYNRLGLLAITAVVLLFLGGLYLGSMRLEQRLQMYEAKKEKLTQEIAEEKERTAEIDSLKTYMKTDAYAEEVAREKLGLVKPDEIVFEEEKTMND